MNRYKYLFVFFLFNLFVSPVYAFTYDIGTNFSNDDLVKGAEIELKVNIKDIKGTNEGIFGCTLDIEFSNNVVLNSKIRSLDNWTMTTGNLYLFDRGMPVLNDTDLFVIPVKVNGNGIVKISNIECNDGNTIEKIDDKVLNFIVKDNSVIDNNNNNNNNNNSDDNDIIIKDSNCDLVDIMLNEGNIEFDSNVLDYYIEVSNINNLVVDPVLDSDKSKFTVTKNDNKILINVEAEDGSKKTYTINVTELEPDIIEEKKNYTPIFIGLIVLLVIINIIRIIKNNKN